MKTFPLYATAIAMTSLNAQDAKPPGDRPPPPIPPVLMLFDVNRDGEISADEIQAAATALGKLDRNGDGKITREEMRPPRPEGEDAAAGAEGPQGPPRVKHPLPPIIAALDADDDGTISASELAAAPESLKKLDKDGDGALSPEEHRPQRPPGFGPGRDGHPKPAP